MAVCLERRTLLRGRLRADPAPLRPPGAVAGSLFPSRCTRCDACVRACPEGIVRRGDGGFPELDFRRGGCTFCGDCARACPEGALRPWEDVAPWPYLARIAEGCLGRLGVTCMSCVDACPEGALRLRPQAGRWVPEVDPGGCSGCGACVAPCPVGAVGVVAAGGR